MKRGFTLIELLVVVAIIAILMAILLPSLGRAREQSKSVFCLNTLRSLTMANETYADEWNNWYVPIRDGKDANTRTWRQKAPYRAILKARIADTWYPLDWPRNLICPNATYALGNPINNNPNAFEMAWSYGMNMTGLTSATYNANLAEGTYMFKRSQIFSPGNRYMLMDSTDWWVGAYASHLYPTWGEVASNGTTYTQAAAYRHLGGINISFFDGHAEALPMRNVNYIYNVAPNPKSDVLAKWFPTAEKSF